MQNFSFLITSACIKNLRSGAVFDVEVADETNSLTSLLFTFKENQKLLVRYLLNEAGLHSWQRVPPTETRGRVHTSSITVVCLPISEKTDEKPLWQPHEIEEYVTRGSGPGGQHRNRTYSAVRLHHLPTKTIIRICTQRSQHQNRALAFDILRSKLQNTQSHHQADAVNYQRRLVTQTPSALKKRTWRVKDDLVIDHQSNKTASLKQVIKGNLELLCAS